MVILGTKDAPRSTFESVRRRMCSREGILELVAFLGWLLVISAHVAQIWALWWFFWQHVVGDVDKRRRRSESTMQLSLRAGVTAAHAATRGGSALTGAFARHAVRPSVTINRAKAVACFAAWVGWLTVAVTARRIFKRLMPAMALRRRELCST